MQDQEMRYTGRPKPILYCDICGQPKEDDSWYGCAPCRKAERAATKQSIERVQEKNKDYWAWKVEEDTFLRNAKEHGMMEMADGSVVAYDTLGERAKNDRINAIHGGKDLREHERVLIKEVW